MSNDTQAGRGGRWSKVVSVSLSRELMDEAIKRAKTVAPDPRKSHGYNFSAYVEGLIRADLKAAVDEIGVSSIVRRAADLTFPRREPQPSDEQTPPRTPAPRRQQGNPRSKDVRREK